MSLLSLQVGSVASGYCNRDTYVVAKVTFVMCHIECGVLASLTRSQQMFYAMEFDCVVDVVKIVLCAYMLYVCT